MKHLIYLRGLPGVGKVTVAKILEKELGWKLFWYHDLKNAVNKIVREHQIQRLMDEVSEPVMGYLLDKGENIIYARPSPDNETVERLRSQVSRYPNTYSIRYC